ncbi:hypothetical protein LS68_006450 [Helicobacter sp. MIT 05-5293]|uniref:hypothetical protein n=1 Tax=Helicobacter sp. MIT 05-5293 TaxID=1548149 RepID=UPI0010FE899D|nr:hypothetical protein [Helicobacter sp. MIT 05-5293]TLD80396.1 hypothetical protein LS68_006450 [Helicobacter sp. MIT 05-5293]
MAFLFDSSDVNVITLSDEEMALTQGEGFFATLAASFAVSAGIGAVKWGFCRLTGGKGCRFTASGKAPF